MTNFLGHASNPLFTLSGGGEGINPSDTPMHILYYRISALKQWIVHKCFFFIIIFNAALTSSRHLFTSIDLNSYCDKIAKNQLHGSVDVALNFYIAILVNR